MEIRPVTVLIIAGIIALLGLIGRLMSLFRQSRRIEKTLDYSKMKEWEDEDD